MRVETNYVKLVTTVPLPFPCLISVLFPQEHLLCVEQDTLQEKWENAVKEYSESEAKKTSQTRMKEQYEKFYSRQREQERIAR